MKKICVVTTTRAEYGLLYWLMKAIASDGALSLQVLVTGMHLSPEFGSTWKQIVEDGFVIDERVDMLLSGDSSQAIAKSIGLGVIGMTDAFARLDPDMVVLLGDRFEALAAAQAAMVARIPIAHLHGGETTEGAIDEAIRHSITKMSHLHFVATDIYRKRVVQLGENPRRVFNVGAPGLEMIRRNEYLSRSEMEKRLDFDLSKPYLLVTYHPVTLSSDSPQVSMESLFRALDALPELNVIISYPNADTNGRELIKLIDEYCACHPSRVIARKSLGQQMYLSLMKNAYAVVGNSSSGIIEAPALSCPTVNIGIRQQGRVMADSIIQCAETEDEIEAAIRQVSTPTYQAILSCLRNPYDSGDTAAQIVSILKKTDFTSLLVKSFYSVE